VLQNSGSTAGSVGIYVENADAFPAGPGITNVVGLASICSSTSVGCRRIAGYFETKPGFACGGFSQEYAIVVPNNGGVSSIGYTPPTISGQQFDVNGNVASNGTTLTSDSILKTNINPIVNSIATIKRLKPKSFYFDTTNNYGLTFSSKKQYGFIAQNVQQILPELIYKGEVLSDSTHAGLAYSTLNYNAFIGLLTAGMQQQQLSIDSLRSNSGGGSSATAYNGLSIDSSAAGQVVLGNDFGSTNAQLTSDREIPLNGNSIYFSSDNTLGANKNRVFIGLDPGSSLPANSKLYVQESSTGSPFRYSTAIDASNLDNATSPSIVLAGISGRAAGTNSSSGTNIGGSFRAQNAPNNNHGIEGVAGTVNLVKGSSLTIFAPAQYVGGVFYANPASGTNAIGVYSSVPNVSGNYAGYFDGDVYVNGGSNSGTGYLVASDAMFKTNINAITNASAIISQLQPKTFYFDTANSYKLHFSNKKQYGLIAQDVQTVLPELVGSSTKPAEYDTAGNVTTAAVTYKNLNYDAFIALLIKSHQEMQSQLDSMKVVMASCCTNNTQMFNKPGNTNKTSAIDVELNNADIIVLNQNTPNPFAEQTTITYNIPQSTNVAQILFYDVNGRQIKAVDITKKGAGQLNVYANDLTNGIYSYTLIADGKIIDTKKMIKQQ
jgi:hypothetical protein